MSGKDGGNLFPTPNKMVKILFTKGSKFLKVVQFLEEFENIYCKHFCDFSSVLCFRNGQVFFYFTRLKLRCGNHTKLFTDSVVPPHAVHSTSEQLCVKLLKPLECYRTPFSLEHCSHLELNFCYYNVDPDDSKAHDSLCDLVEQVKNPDRCSLSIDNCVLTSTGAVKLASLLPWFEHVTLLCLSLAKCSTDAVARLVAAIKHKTLKELLLQIGEINLTSAVVEALCQSLPELLALQELLICNLDGCRLLLTGLDYLDDLDYSWRSPYMKICGVTDSSAEAITRLIDVFDHNIFRELKLKEIHLTPAVAEVLAQLLPKLSALRSLKIKSLTECSDGAVTRLIDGINFKTLEELKLSKTKLTSAVAEALFGRFSRPSSLTQLSITHFSARGSLGSITNNLCLFPNLRELDLECLDMGEADLSDLLENLKFTPNLECLYLWGNPLGHAVRSMVPYLIEQQKLELVRFRRRDCSRENLKYVQEAVKEKRPQLKLDVW